MSEETIINKIKTDAKQKQEAIIKEAEKEAKRIKNDATKNAKKQAEEILHKGKQQAENQKKILISQAHQNAKRDEMNAKEEIIETCFDNAMKTLQQLDENKYKDLVKQLMIKGHKQIPGTCTVKTSKSVDKNIAEDLGLKVTGSISASGGIILTSEEGTISVDNTFEGILKREKHRIRVNVGKLLFDTTD